MAYPNYPPGNYLYMYYLYFCRYHPYYCHGGGGRPTYDYYIPYRGLPSSDEK